MRIAVLSRYSGIVNRGVESWSVNLCEQLQQLGHSCLLIQGGTAVPEGLSFRTLSLNVPLPAASERVFRGPASKVVARCYASTGERDVARFAAQALPHLIAFRPDIVVPANGFWTIIAAKIAGWCTGGRARIVVASQAGWSQFERDALRLGIDGFVAIQPHVYHCAVQFERGRTPIQLIPNGVDIEHFARGPKAHVDLIPPIVIVVSALDDYKQVDCAVQAVARAGMSLLLLGDGPNAHRIGRLAHALLGPQRYLHLPKVPHFEVAAYYRAADVFTLPSTAGEAFGITILEAMAAGLPVVVNDDPVRRWIVGEYGWFVDARDTNAYAHALISAATAQPSAAIEKHLAQFGWPVVAAKLARFFEQVHATSRPVSSPLLSLPRLGTKVTLRTWDYVSPRMHQRGR